MLTNWRKLILTRAERWLSRHQTPLPLRELGWKMVLFVARCGKSNPLSFGLRLIFDHKKMRAGMGWALVLGVILAVISVPGATLAANSGGQLEVATVSDGEVTPRTNTAVQVPLPSVDISQKFWLLHPAIDMVTPSGTRVKPVMAGRVKTIGYERFGYGNFVIVEHEGGYESLYAHLSKVEVTDGQVVKLETVLAESGTTGRSTGPHLHLEIHYEGKAVDPATILGIK